MKKFAIFAIAAALMLNACDDDKNDNKPSNNTNNQSSSENGSSNGSSDGTDESIDYAKFCDLIMGKTCGENISDVDLASCAEQYKAEAEKAKEKCDAQVKAYFRCIINSEATFCSNDDICKTELDNYSACAGESGGESGDEIDFDKFCDIIMGKTCGAEISEADLAQCVVDYKADAEKAKDKCDEQVKTYFKCVLNSEAAICTDDDVCKTEIESYSACAGESGDEIDFDKFCDIIMGKTCGAEISEADLAQCVVDYKADAEKAKDKCDEQVKTYFNCVLNSEATICTDDDVCKTEIESYSACAGEK